MRPTRPGGGARRPLHLTPGGATRPRRPATATHACPFRGLLFSDSLSDMPFKPTPPGKPYRLLLGLRQPEDPWLHVDEDEGLFLDQLAQRRKHLAERRDVVLQCVDEVGLRGREARGWWRDQQGFYGGGVVVLPPALGRAGAAWVCSEGCTKSVRGQTDSADSPALPVRAAP